MNWLREIPLAGWLCIGFILIIFVVTNLTLVNALIRRNRPNQNQARKPDKINPSFTSPWQAEDRQFDELSHWADELRRREHKDK